MPGWLYPEPSTKEVMAWIKKSLDEYGECPPPQTERIQTEDELRGFDRGLRAAQRFGRMLDGPSEEPVGVAALPVTIEPVPAAKPCLQQTLIDKLAEFTCALSLEEFAAIYIDGDRSLKLKCRALQHAVKTDGIPFFRRGRRMKFDPVELVEHIRRRSFTSKKPPRADGRDITRRIAARRKR